MGRPRANEQGPGAVERVIEAFWAMLAEMPFPSIKVSALARRAHVSPNTIYYHFDGIHDVARRALVEDLDARFVAAVLSGGINEPFEVRADEDGRFVRLAAFARSGSAELTAMLLGELRGRWLDAAGLCEEDLSVEQRQDLSFVFGGLLAMLAEYEPIDGAEMLSGFAFRPLGRGVVDTMRLLAGTAQ